MLITFQRIAHTYSMDSPSSHAALKGIDLEIPEGKVTTIIEEAGSGKSILVQHLSALLLPNGGGVQMLDRTVTAGGKPKNLKELHRPVGLVFRFPEYQLPEKTIKKDISFGSKNLGISAEEAVQRAKEILRVISLGKSYLQRSPFDLSGGQKRRIVITEILVMSPDVLVPDEPTARLDPQGASDTMRLFADVSKKYGKTVLIAAHDMEHILQYCEEVVVTQDRSIKKHYDVQPLFETVKFPQELSINPPVVVRFREELIRCGFSIDHTLLDMDKLAAAVACEVKRHERYRA